MSERGEGGTLRTLPLDAVPDLAAASSGLLIQA